MPKLNPYLECGKIINTHGCKGGMKVDPWMDSPEDFCDLERVFIGDSEHKIPHKVIHTSVMQGRFILLTLEGVNDMDAAEALRDTVLYAAREDFHLEEGEYFIADLTGLRVIHADTGAVLGRVKEVINRGASDLYVVQTDKGEGMIPAVDEFVDRVDPKEGIFVRPIEGMLE